MGCGDVCLLNDEGFRAIEGSSRPPLINLTVPCRELGILPVTLYRYVGPQGQLREQGQKVLAT